MRAPPPTADDKVLGELCRFAAGAHPAGDDVLCLMILLHTHQLVFSRPILPERPAIEELPALTQRGAASVVSTAFPQHTPTELYWMFNTAPGNGQFELIADVPPVLAARVASLREALLAHPDVKSVDPSD